MKKSIILLSVFIFTACSGQNKLDNETALKILNDNYIEHCKDEVKSFVSMAYDGPNYSYYENHFELLEHNGLVSLKKRTYRDGKTSITINYTNLAVQQYSAGSGFSSFKVAMVKFIPKEIIGISSSEDGNKAEVIFKGDLEATPFYTIIKSKKHCKETKNVERKATFIRYDTGWRIEQ